MTARLPADLISLADYARHAAARLDPALLAYIDGGSADEQTLAANRSSFARVQIVPRVLRGGAGGSTGLQLLGQSLQHPLLLAPVAYQRLVHTGGEVASAQAATATDTLMVLSTLSSTSLEEVAPHAAARWFQLYLQPRREHSLALVRRAEAAGYQAIVVTLDTPVQSPPRQAQRLGFRPPDGISAVNLQGYAGSPRELFAGDSRVFQGALTDAPDWDALRWLRDSTTLPLVAKGVAHPDDGERLREEGVDAIIVSNHGGRALDGSPASLDLLPAMRHWLGADYPLLLDGGVRSGNDVFKALALGANAVLIGRPQLHALAVAGALGVAHMLRLLRDELEVCMAQAGCRELRQIDQRALYRPCSWPPSNP
jgi:isopentenyl diphosphate isomerase/L-lactate dehydrogenase-like FMN-dependent dehydrogenase